MKKRYKSVIILALSLCSAAVSAEACTYNEAILAMEKGNMLRGMALLQMAVRDGDRRAVDALAQLNKLKQLPTSNKLLASN